MALAIETFSNATGGNAFYKAISHPDAAARIQGLIARLAGDGPVALYDPHGLAPGFAALYDLTALPLAGVYVQDVSDIGRELLGERARPVTDLKGSGAKSVLIAAFDADKLARHLAPLIPDGAHIESLDAARIDDALIGHSGRYLNPLNFATNFAFFRDQDGLHTRLVSANYWARYGANDITLWLRLFGADGAPLADWTEQLAPTQQSVVIDSAEIRARFGLGPFTGQLMMHAIGAAGHDVVKYALDIYSDDGDTLSCSHDANAWPADLYAGLPAPAPGEKVLLWVQNSHPSPIPAGEIGLNLMGSDDVRFLGKDIAPFATHALDVGTLLPDAAWPAQIELRAGRHFVRPRYEVLNGGGGRRIAHVNVERVDLKPDPALADLSNLMGKGFILPAPILPTDRWRTELLPTPMATTQRELPLAALIVDASGREIARQPLGRLPRDHRQALDLAALTGDAALPSGYGHVELVYDFSAGGEADGWLHAIFRYRRRDGHHAAETSFGAHMFNTALTYKGEPQAYSGPAPGLSTRLFLRLGPAPLDTLCHLIYPASTPWHPLSETRLWLFDGDGEMVADKALEIPCGGSHLFRYSEAFSDAERRRAGDRAHLVVRDETCRLFGYHGLLDADGRFSLDHMFGF